MTDTQLQFSSGDTREYFGGLEELVAALGLAGAAPDAQLAVVGQFMELVFKRMLLHVPKEKAALISALIDSDDGDALFAALKDNVDDFAKHFREEIAAATLEFARK